MGSFDPPGLPRTYTVTTGTGPCVLDDAIPANAQLYKIEMGNGWEIGVVSANPPIGFMPSLARNPIISSSGLRKAINWSAGIKEVHFSETIPDWVAKESQKS